MDLVLTTPHFSRVKNNVGVAEETDDRRKSERFPLKARLALGLSNNQVLRGHTVDISEGGLSILVPEAITVGQSCRVLFTAVTKDRTYEIKGYGIIANCTCTREGFRIGMTFEGVDAYNKQLTQELITDRQAG